MFSNIISAIPTPFKNAVFDQDAYAKFIDWQIGHGISGLVPVGTTGESPSLSPEEHVNVIKACVESTAGRVSVIAGSGSNNTIETIYFSQHAQKVGADALLLVAPYYSNPTQEGIYQHFKKINQEVDIPMIVYNIPSRSVVDILPETMLRISELEHVVGVKDATGSMQRVSQMRNLIGEDFSLLSGDDPSLLGFRAQGGHGCISVVSNVVPKLFVEMDNKIEAGDFVGARKIFDRLVPLQLALFSEPNPQPVKAALAILGHFSEEIRLPLIPVSDITRARLRNVLEGLGLL